MIHARNDYNRIQDPLKLIPEDEPVFLLRAQDKTAAETLRHWAMLNKLMAVHDHEAVRLALIQAHRMDKWPVKKTADI